MDLKGNAATEGDKTLDIKGADGAVTKVENLAEIDIPGHAFEVPLSDDGNRGRGYYVNLVAGTAVPLAVGMPELMVITTYWLELMPVPR